MANLFLTIIKSRVTKLSNEVTVIAFLQRYSISTFYEAQLHRTLVLFEYNEDYSHIYQSEENIKWSSLLHSVTGIDRRNDTYNVTS